MVNGNPVLVAPPLYSPQEVTLYGAVQSDPLTYSPVFTTSPRDYEVVLYAYGNGTAYFNVFFDPVEVFGGLPIMIHPYDFHVDVEVVGTAIQDPSFQIEGGTYTGVAAWHKMLTIDEYLKIGFPTGLTNVPPLMIGLPQAKMGLQNTGTNGSSGISFYDNTGAEKGWLCRDATTGSLQLGSDANTSALSVAGTNVVVSGGNLGVKVSTPAESVDVNGNIQASGIVRIGTTSNGVTLKNARMLEIKNGDASDWLSLRAGSGTFEGNIYGKGNVTMQRVWNTPTSVSTNTTLDANGGSTVYFVTATGTTITLPTAASISGRTWTIKLTTAGSCTIATTSSQTIDGATSYSLSAINKYVTVISDGSNWQIMGNN
jgi:hypothetical protein